MEMQTQARQQPVITVAAEVDISTVKISILAVANAVFSFLAGFSAYKILFSEVNGIYEWMLLASLLLFFVFATLHVFFIKSIGKLTLFAILDCLVLLLPFFDFFYPSPTLLIGGVVGGGALLFVIFRLFGLVRARKFLANSLDIHFMEVSHIFLRQMTIGLLIITIVFGYTYAVKTSESNSNKLGENVTRYILLSSEAMIRSLLPKFSVELSARAIVEDIVSVQLEQQGIDVGLIPKRERDRALDQFLAQIGFTSSPETVELDDPISEALYGFLKSKFTGLDRTMKLTVGAGLLLLIFFTLKSVLGIMSIGIAGVTYIIFKLFILANFAYITAESRTREFVILP